MRIFGHGFMKKVVCEDHILFEIIITEKKSKTFILGIILNGANLTVHEKLTLVNMQQHVWVHYDSLMCISIQYGLTITCKIKTGFEKYKKQFKTIVWTLNAW